VGEAIKTNEKILIFMRRSRFRPEEIAKELYISEEVLVKKIHNNSFTKLDVDTLRWRLGIK
jgi:hypothetical protein